MNFPLAAVRELVSAVRKDGRPVVRLTCADYGTEWVVAADVYPADELSVQPRSVGPYVFGTAQGARKFIENSLVALRLLGCEVA
jgi:hypothetical protein